MRIICKRLMTHCAHTRRSVSLLPPACRGHSPEVVCGHSLGGKVALEYLVQTSEPSSSVRPPLHTWVCDSQPGLVAEGLVSDVDKVIQAVKACSLLCDSAFC